MEAQSVETEDNVDLTEEISTVAIHWNQIEELPA